MPGMSEAPTQVGRSSGRVRLRANRGFPVGPSSIVLVIVLVLVIDL
jgi:hypothetical protein